jgi:hypothetical protein
VREYVEILVSMPEGVEMLGWELREFVMGQARGEVRETQVDTEIEEELEGFWLAELQFAMR